MHLGAGGDLRSDLLRCAIKHEQRVVGVLSMLCRKLSE